MLEPMLNRFTDAFMGHYGEVSKVYANAMHVYHNLANYNGPFLNQQMRLCDIKDSCIY